MRDTAFPAITALLERDTAEKLARRTTDPTITGTGSSSPRTAGPGPSTAAAAHATAAVDRAMDPPDDPPDESGPALSPLPEPDEEWAARQADERARFLAAVQAEVATLHQHLLLDRAKRAHPAGSHAYGSTTDPDAVLANPFVPVTAAPVGPGVAASTGTSADPDATGDETLDGEGDRSARGAKIVHVYESLWSNNPRRRSNRKIQRHVARWQDRGYQLAGVDDNREGESGVLRATLTFHRGATDR